MDTHPKRLEDLITWQRTMDLAGQLIQHVESAESQLPGWLALMLLTAAVDAPSHIAHGFEHGDPQTFVKLLSEAKGTVGRVRTILYLARQEVWLPVDPFTTFLEQTDDVARLIAGLRKAVQKRGPGAGD